MRSGDSLERSVAVVIITVTLVGAFVAFLQTQAGNRESSADRKAQVASVATMTSVVDATRKLGRHAFVVDASTDQALLQQSYSAERGPARSYAAELAVVHGEGGPAVDAYMSKLFGSKYVGQGGVFNPFVFYEDEIKGGYWNGELQKAHARERDAWSSKGRRYVTVITIFALALFLLGLTLTVPGNARQPFFWAGCVVASGAMIWGAVIFAERVQRPSPTAIQAYVDGQARFDAITYYPQEPAVRTEQYRLIANHFSRAIEERDDYQEAYLWRGTVRFFADLQQEDGPDGSDEARADFVRAAELNRDDYIAWGNLGAAQFWLDDYEPALRSTARALHLEPDDVIFNLNRALFLVVSGRTDEYEQQMERVREVFVAAPTWLRGLSMIRYDEVIDQGLKHRPRIREGIETLRDDLRELYASVRTSGEPQPNPVDAELGESSFTLDEPDRVGSFGAFPRVMVNQGVANPPSATFTPPSAGSLEQGGWVTQDRLLRTSISYTRIRRSDRWLLDTYVDGRRVPELSHGPEKWRFKTPRGRFTITLPGAGRLYPPGVDVRTEIFVEGNLLGAVEYEYASAASP